MDIKSLSEIPTDIIPLISKNQSNYNKFIFNFIIHRLLDKSGEGKEFDKCNYQHINFLINQPEFIYDLLRF